MYYLILALAIFDTLTLLCALATRGFPSLRIESVSEFGANIAPFTFPMALISYTGSVYITMFLAYERYSAICRKAQWSKLEKTNQEMLKRL